MNFITENLVMILTSLLGAGGIWGYLFERNKNKAITKGVEADVDGKEITNTSRVVDLYKEAIDDLQNKYEKRFEETAEMYEKKCTMLRDEIQHLEESYQRKTKLLEDEIKLKNKFIASLRRDLRERDVEIKRLKSGDNNTK